jgi:selT/selW/selH-like putative selenoprotein
MKKETGVDADLVAGKVGQFDVIVDGKVIFSKHAEGRFPDEEEIIRSLPG